MVEVIKCKCGSVFAACTEGYQDDEWVNNRLEYQKQGSTVEFLEADQFEFENCKCPPPEEKQLSLFITTKKKE